MSTSQKGGDVLRLGSKGRHWCNLQAKLCDPCLSAFEALCGNTQIDACILCFTLLLVWCSCGVQCGVDEGRRMQWLSGHVRDPDVDTSCHHTANWRDSSASHDASRHAHYRCAAAELLCCNNNKWSKNFDERSHRLRVTPGGSEWIRPTLTPHLLQWCPDQLSLSLRRSHSGTSSSIPY